MIQTSRSAQLAPMRIADSPTVHLGSLSLLTGPNGEARYGSWCPASRGRGGEATPDTVSGALAERITCRWCLRNAPAEALHQAQETADQLADRQIDAKFTAPAVADLLGELLRELLCLKIVAVHVFANAFEVVGGPDQADSCMVVPGTFTVEQVARVLRTRPDQLTDYTHTAYEF